MERIKYRAARCPSPTDFNQRKIPEILIHEENVS